MARRGTTQWRFDNWGTPDYPRRGYIPLVKVSFCGHVLACHRDAAEAFLAMAAVIERVGYQVRREDTGIYAPRAITGGSSPSPHAWAIAIDINWLTNPYASRLKTDHPLEMREGIKALRTRGGQQVFQWGGDWNSVKDAMHYDIIATPAELAQGIEPGDDDMPLNDADKAWINQNQLHYQLIFDEHIKQMEERVSQRLLDLEVRLTKALKA